MDILNHRLVDCEAVHLTCSKNTRPLTAPDTIVLHYTAGSNGLASAYYLTRPDVAASAHLVIDRNGDRTVCHKLFWMDPIICADGFEESAVIGDNLADRTFPLVFDVFQIRWSRFFQNTVTGFMADILTHL